MGGNASVGCQKVNGLGRHRDNVDSQIKVHDVVIHFSDKAMDFKFAKTCFEAAKYSLQLRKVGKLNFSGDSTEGCALPLFTHYASDFKHTKFIGTHAHER